jgi:putative ABC transport system permease protein
MKLLYRLWGVLTAIPYRMLAQWELVLAATVGLVASISLILSIPLYADAVYYRNLQENIIDGTGNEAKSRPPFSFLFQYYGGWHGNLNWEDIQPVDDYLTNSVESTLALPQQEMVRYISTDTYPLVTEGEFTFSAGSQITYASLGVMNDLSDHIRLVDGSLPGARSKFDGEALEVLISSTLAEESGYQVGETYQLYVSEGWSINREPLAQIPVRIVGVWEPIDPDEDYWISNPSFYSNVLFIPQESFATIVDQLIPEAIFSAYWYFIMDVSDVYSGDVQPILRKIHKLERNTNNLLPNMRLLVSPVEVLTNYQRASDVLTILLYAFTVPIIGLILAFISLVSRLSVERQRNEIAVMRSRGASPIQVLSFTILEGVLLGILALVISLSLATQLTIWIGQTRSFMEFSSASNLRVGISTEVLRIGFFAVVLVLITMLIPAIRASRHTIVSYKREVGRASSKPWWQRAWLDVLILIPAAYGIYLLEQQGRIVVFGNQGGEDPFQNPLFFIIPALGIFALTLFSLRFIQPIMAVIAKIAGLTKIASLTLAARQLSRTPGNYYTPLIILILTVSLSSYTASLAYTFDQHLFDQNYYRLGADIRFLDVGDSSQLNATANEDGEAAEGWQFIPVHEYLKLEGVESVTRLGRYTANANIGTGSTEGLFFGVDWEDFPRVSFWRDDFSSESVEDLMNRLALDPAGVLVSDDYLRQNGLKIGDPINLRVHTFGQNNVFSVNVVGSFKYFPMWYPQEGPLFVGNLDYLFEQAGDEFPYRVLLRVEDDVDPAALGQEGLHSLDYNVRYLSWDTPVKEINATQAQPERQGLFGFLFIGFATAALLTALAFLLYVLFSFRQRFIELGVLRAAGLSMAQMSGYMIWELTFLILLGVSIGTVLGVLASNLFIPYLQIGSQMSALIPPFKVLIAWPMIFQIYLMFAGLFGVTLIVLLISLRRMRIFQAIKLGETV